MPNVDRSRSWPGDTPPACLAQPLPKCIVLPVLVQHLLLAHDSAPSPSSRLKLPAQARLRLPDRNSWAASPQISAAGKTTTHQYGHSALIASRAAFQIPHTDWDKRTARHGYLELAQTPSHLPAAITRPSFDPEFCNRRTFRSASSLRRLPLAAGHISAVPVAANARTNGKKILIRTARAYIEQ